MTRDNKEILLKVLSEQLSYGVLILDIPAEKYGKLYQINNSGSVWYDCQETGDVECQSIFNVKPYLRPMSSMTEEEKSELKQEHTKDEKLYAECLTRAAKGDYSMRGKVVIHYAADWCNKNHFDYRGLIEKGLALEAPEGMYKLL